MVTHGGSGIGSGTGSGTVLLGEGPLASVYADPFGALKVYRGGLDRRSRTAVERELSQWRQVPATLPVLNLEELPDGRFAVRLERCAYSLAARVDRSGPLPGAQVLDLGQVLADSLASAHQRGLVHGAVTARNVLFRASGEPVLADGGTALRTAFRADPPVDFAAPETLRDAVRDARTDLYGLGAVLYYALVGHVPYPARMGEQEADRVLRVLADPVPEVNRPDLPDGLADLVRRMLAKDPDDRPDDVGGELARIVGPGFDDFAHVPAHPMPVSPPLPMSPPMSQPLPVPVPPGVPGHLPPLPGDAPTPAAPAPRTGEPASDPAGATPTFATGGSAGATPPFATGDPAAAPAYPIGSGPIGSGPATAAPAFPLPGYAPAQPPAVGPYPPPRSPGGRTQVAEAKPPKRDRRGRLGLIAGVAGALVLFGSAPFLLLGEEPPASAPAAPPITPSSSTPAVQIELLSAVDNGDHAELTWTSSADLDFVVIIAREGAKNEHSTELRERSTRIPIDPNPDVKYCFSVQGTDRKEVYESQPKPIRGAKCAT